MKLNNTTAVPNVFFDTHISELSGSAIRVYLKIVRNTIGWRDRDGNSKKRDWIAHSQFEQTGLSNRSVTNGIQELLEKNLIEVTDYIGNSLTNPTKRKKAKRVFYSIVFHNSEKNTFQTEKNVPKPKQDLLSTKETFTKEKYNAEATQGTKRITDSQRIYQIRDEQQRKQIQRDGWLYR